MLASETRDKVFNLMESPQISQVQVNEGKFCGSHIIIHMENDIEPFLVMDYLRKVFPEMTHFKSRNRDFPGGKVCTDYSAKVENVEVMICVYKEKKAPAITEGILETNHPDSTTEGAVAQ